jgi:hypothetical protein
MKPSITALAQLSIIALLLSFAFFSVGQENSKDKTATPIATCYGKKDCNGCKNCKYCKHCAKDGGTCGVCKE